MTSSHDIARQATNDRRPVTDQEVNEAVDYLKFLHHDSDGWIPLFSKRLTGERRTRCYKYEQLTAELLKSEWAGKLNSYVGLNTMFIPRRKNRNTRQLRAIGLDLDYRYVEGLYHLNHEEFIALLELDWFGKRIPEPNVIIHGYNIQLIILIEPAPYKQTCKLWKALVSHFVSEMNELGADGNCKDYARVMRLPGTWHREGNKITADYRHTHRYSLKELQSEYLPSLPPDWKQQKAKRLKAKRAKGKKAAKDQTRHAPRRHTTRTLNQQRMCDLEKLCELRGWNIKGHREQVLFLYRYHALLCHEQPTLAYQQMLELNSKFSRPYEDLDATNSAEEMWRDLQNGLRAEERRKASSESNQIEYRNPGYNFSNVRLIEMLGITADEERHLSTIISQVEKERRRKVRKSTRQKRDANRRREQGKISRDEYVTPAQLRRIEAEKLRHEGLSYRKIGVELGCSESEIRRCLKNVPTSRSAHGYGSLDCGGGVALSLDNRQPLQVRDSKMAQKLICWYSSTLEVESLPHIDHDHAATELAATKWMGNLLYQIGANVPPWLPNSVLRYTAAWFHLHKESLSTKLLAAVLVSAPCSMEDAAVTLAS